MASYHLSVKTVQRSAGRSATAAIAYRTASRVLCEREGRVHDYRAKAGVEATLLLVPQDAPTWAHDRQALAPQRQGAVVVQQHDRLRRRLAGQAFVGGPTWRSTPRTARAISGTGMPMC